MNIFVYLSSLIDKKMDFVFELIMLVLPIFCANTYFNSALKKLRKQLNQSYVADTLAVDSASVASVLCKLILAMMM
jgi:fumarate reductase subunit D